VELLILLLGIVVTYNSARADTDPDMNESLVVFAYVMVVVSVVSLTIFLVGSDVYFWWRSRTYEKLASSVHLKSILDSTDFHTGRALLRWFESAEEVDKETLRQIDVLLRKQMLQGGQSAKDLQRRSMYSKLGAGCPPLLDFLLVDVATHGRSHSCAELMKQVAISLSKDSLRSHPQLEAAARSQLYAVKILPSTSPGLLLQWLCEEASKEEAHLFSGFISSVQSKKLSDVAAGGKLAAIGVQAQAATNRAQEATARIAADAGKLAATGVQAATDLAQKATAQDVAEVKATPGALARMSSTRKVSTTRHVGDWRKTRRVVQLMAANLIDSRTLVHKNKLQRYLDALVLSLNCEAVQLIPVGGTGHISGQLWTSHPETVERLESDFDWGHDDDSSPAGLCARSGQPVRVTNILLDSRFAGLRLQLRRALRWHSLFSQLSQLCVPVLVHSGPTTGDSESSGAVVGVLRLLNKMSKSGQHSGRPFREVEQLAAEDCARLISKDGQGQVRQRSGIDNKGPLRAEQMSRVLGRFCTSTPTQAHRTVLHDLSSSTEQMPNLACSLESAGGVEALDVELSVAGACTETAAPDRPTKLCSTVDGSLEANEALPQNRGRRRSTRRRRTLPQNERGESHTESDAKNAGLQSGMSDDADGSADDATLENFSSASRRKDITQSIPAPTAAQPCAPQLGSSAGADHGDSASLSSDMVAFLREAVQAELDKHSLGGRTFEQTGAAQSAGRRRRRSRTPERTARDNFLD
jgi:hypothetical protein